MTAQIISGTQVAEGILKELKGKVEIVKQKGITPGLVIVRVGEDPASISYVKQKEKASAGIGIWSKTIVLPETATEKDLLDQVTTLNKDINVHGILVQLPLPGQISEEKILDAIDPKKDVDGFHPVNVGRLLIGNPYFMPCTPHGIQQLLVRSGNDPEGKHVVICGRSLLVGKPLMAIMIQKQKGANATVTMVHTGTKNMVEITRQADILIVAVGKPMAVTADMVKDGVVVIDVGVNRIPDAARKSGFRLVGDTEYDKIVLKAKAITPVPGGVGPMTVTMLMWNTVIAAQRVADGK
ncbi:MAG: bifunctional 5,10-methylene-tetrahydrofolate dehydrogenase/5,10-methylene-tetrahydrofolate cyclohydrolase [Chloroflexi bacterium]|nr:bifunctional 5,10-methylene-tetrahydrofolate dehydrogenase/5,10-methylene-tetrahydrofolate cyclohydrolase [Chloroflexota bacterium]